MSVVAWDGKTIAADKQVTNAELRFKTTKLRRLSSGEVLAWIGVVDCSLMLVQWYEQGADPEKWPKFQGDKENWVRLIVASRYPSDLMDAPRSRVKVFETQPISAKIEDDFMAWGVGRDFALGAMAMGASAREAVEITCRFSASCGLGVDVMEL